MKKKCFFIGLLLGVFLLSSVFADITMLYPVQKRLKHNESIDIGNASKGETINLVIASESNYGQAFKWDQAIIENTPIDWVKVNSEIGKKTLNVKLIIPKNAVIGDNNFKIKMNNLAGDIRNEEINVKVNVTNNNQKHSLKKYALNGVYGEEMEFNLISLNNSIAEHSFKVSSNIPRTWFEGTEFTVPGKSSKEIKLKVKPIAYGYHKFKFFVKSKLNDEMQEFEVELTVKPTIKSKFDAAVNAFPFFTPNLSILYLFNAVLSIFM